MKNIIILFLIFKVFLFSDTSIPGGEVFGEWSFDDSPYLIEGEITIPDGETLLIDPGVLVEFQGHYKLNVQGCLLAIGTANDSITFTPVDTEIGWFGIRFCNTPATNDSSKIVFCKIEYGSANGPDYDDFYGGGIYIQNYNKVLIFYSNISHNHADYSGAGIYCNSYSSPIISNNKIAFNNAGNSMPGGGSGAAISLNDYSSPLFFNNEISYNSSYSASGILCNYDSSPIILNNNIHHNWSIINSGIYISNSEPKIINNIITENHCDFYSCAIFCDGLGETLIVNNTITNNFALYGAGILCSYNASPLLINNIFWGNSAAEGNNVYLEDSTASPNFFNCIIQGGIEDFGGDGAESFMGDYENCLDSDPLFTNSLENPFDILENSPCINSGIIDTTGLQLPEFDFAGNPRIIGSRIDIGAYENQSVFADDYNLTSIISELSNYPNPFNPTTTISFKIPSRVLDQNPAQDFKNTKIEIYNIKGQMIKELRITNYELGINEVVWEGNDDSGKDVSSGVYFYKLIVNDKIEAVKKCLLLK
ncbi:MAG: right-handed parallel beta-helix repeat-containing protein [Candidatus Cloacimonetes bacterium]|nr:right-handed parallel beta-helix repeat-containing protein [Candidatus Cloacimonadota bacterium]